MTNSLAKTHFNTVSFVVRYYFLYSDITLYIFFDIYGDTVIHASQFVKGNDKSNMNDFGKNIHDPTTKSNFLKIGGVANGSHIHSQ